MNRNDRYDSMLEYYGGLFTVDWQLLKRQIAAESSFDPNARSSAGAIGLAQFMPATFQECANDLKLVNANPYNPECSIECQAWYMAQLIGHYHGDLRQALAAYNFGMGNVDSGTQWPPETVAYVDKILKSVE